MCRGVEWRWRPFERGERSSITVDFDRLHGGHDTEDVDERTGGQLLWWPVDDEEGREAAERGGCGGCVAPLFDSPAGRSWSVVAASRTRRKPTTRQ